MSITNISNSKSVLAKLLAQENLSVEHKKVHTASFDPKNRILTLPVWKDMSNDLYDLLVGHEVGHAWETPAEGWHNAVEQKGKGFKSFLNVVEDARIEKCIKTRYPGLRAPFYRAYQELHGKDFFGLKSLNLDITDLKLIDRLNLHFKIGPFLNVPFHEEEKTYITRMEKANSWDEVYNIASDLYDLHKEKDTTFDLDDIEDYLDSYGDWEEDGDSEYIDGDTTNISKTFKGSRGGESSPESITDSNFRENEQNLLSDSIMPYVYCNMPVVNPNEFIVPHHVIYNDSLYNKIDNFLHYFIQCGYTTENLKKEELDIISNFFNPSRLYNEYREKNMKFIQYLVKEFELKRNASQYARASVSKTGELDLDKVWSFKLKEDLFKRVTKIPNGKNHGMVMFVDWSGSMGEYLSSTIEQVLILADFCKKVNIPFEVYAFTDNTTVKKMIPNHNQVNRGYYRVAKDMVFEFSSFSLLNLLSSKMNSNSYKLAQKRLLQIAECYHHARFDKPILNAASKCKTSVVPTALVLGGTPLDEAVLLANYIVPKFNEQYRIDVSNTIFLTDGDGADHRCFYDSSLSIKSFPGMTNSKNYNLVIKDKETGISCVAKPGEPATSALLRMLKERTHTNLVGYFITQRNIKGTLYNLSNIYGQSVDQNKAGEFIRKYKFYGLENTGYDKYFIVQSKDLEIQDSTIDTKDDTSKRALTKAFVTLQKNKLLNRVLLSKFVEQIA